VLVSFPHTLWRPAQELCGYIKYFLSQSFNRNYFCVCPDLYLILVILIFAWKILYFPLSFLSDDKVIH